MIYISDTLSLNDDEVEISAIRAQGSDDQKTQHGATKALRKKVDF